MRNMNDAVKDRIGQLSLSLCEAEVLLADREARIAELEAEIDTFKKRSAVRKPMRKPKG